MTPNDLPATRPRHADAEQRLRFDLVAMILPHQRDHRAVIELAEWILDGPFEEDTDD